MAGHLASQMAQLKSIEHCEIAKTLAWAGTIRLAGSECVKLRDDPEIPSIQMSAVSSIRDGTCPFAIYSNEEDKSSCSAKDESKENDEGSRLSQGEFLRETTSLLHESEAAAVVEYIETVAPVLYAVYFSILFQLPNAKYYEDMQGMTEEKMHRVMTNILIYTGLELLSLVYVFCMLKRHFGVSVFYQLAFALESDWRTYQCNFMV